MEDSKEIEYLNDCIKTMKQTGSCSYRIGIKASIRLKDEFFIPGMKLRVHLPVAAGCDQQSCIQIHHLFPEGAVIDDETAGQRTVFWEKTMEENHEFTIEYSYVHTVIYHDLEKMIPDRNQPDFYTYEQPPHIRFTPKIKALADMIIGNEQNPIIKAKKIYDFITLNMKYTFMPDYFTLKDIVENCVSSHTGDCGVFALLFITLCRYAKIPARWQGGYAAEPNFLGGHDWAQFYIAPYGWLFADPSYGIGAVRRHNEEHRQFYFGNRDVFRTVLSNDFQVPFTVEKNYWRQDPYDNQSGEMETEERGFLYNELECKQTIFEFKKINE